MEHKQELIVNFDKNTSRSSLETVPYITFFLIILFLLSFIYSGTYIIFLRFILLILTIFIGTGALHTLMIHKTTSPAMIINQEGIWLYYFGFIPWQAIVYLDTYRFGNCPMEYIAINVEDVNILKKQATISGKMGLFWSKVFKTPNITLYGLDRPNYEIIRFMSHFYKHKQ